MIIPSSDGVEVPVHDLGGTGPRLVISHATGFHGRAYLTLARELADRYHSIAFDYRGHGDARTPPEALDGSLTGTKYDWNHYGDDARVVATALREEEGVPLIGFGHSMGGAGLILAAHHDPSLFRALVLYEPIIFPPDALRPSDAPNPLADGARRRRATFASHEAAIENYAAKRPLSAFPREALEAYVRFGFREGEDGQVHLKCLPETEAGTFEGSGSHDAWDLLPEIRIPVLVLAGAMEPDAPPAAVAERVAARLPEGSHQGLRDLDHFGPMTHPAAVAATITQFT